MTTEKAVEIVMHGCSHSKDDKICPACREYVARFILSLDKLDKDKK